LPTERAASALPATPRPSSASPQRAKSSGAGELAAASENGKTLLNRGQAYLYGNGVPRNCAQALAFLYKAADGGNAEARSQLGTLYATGHCVSLDRARAFNWFTLAAGVAPERNAWVEHNRKMLWDQMTDSEKAQTLGGPE
jgi:hypothetical protein